MYDRGRVSNRRYFIHRARQVLGLAAVFLLAAGAVSFSTQFAVGTSAIPAPSTSGDVWAAGERAAHRISGDTNQITHRIPLPREARALAVDPRDQALWVLSHKTLLKFDATTSLVLERDLRTLGQKRKGFDHDDAQLQLNPHDGSLWIAAKKDLLHLDAQGNLLSEWRAPKSIEALALGLDETPWLVTKKALIHLSAAGSVLQQWESKKDFRDEPEHLAIDSLGGLAWVATEHGLLKINLLDPIPAPVVVALPSSSGRHGGKTNDHDGEEDDNDRDDHDGDRDDEDHEGRHAKPRALALNPFSGELWVARKTDLLKFDRAGQVVTTVDLRARKVKKPEAIAFEPVSQSLWLAADENLVRFSSTGDVLATLDFGHREKLEAWGVAPGSVLPALTLLGPADGVLTNNPFFPIRLELTALCSGNPCDLGQGYLDTLSVNATLNDQAIGSGFHVNGNIATFTPTTRFPEGLNTLTAQVLDTLGHLSNTVTSTFTVDTIPPEIQLELPVQTLTRIAAQTFRGTLSEPATLTINGQFVALDADQKFDYPVTLQEGANPFELVATDLAGNTTRRSITLTLDTISPVFLSVSPADGTIVAAPQVTIEGALDDATATVVLEELSELEGTVDSSNPLAFKFTVTLQPGANTLTLVASDPAGNLARAVLQITLAATNIKITNLVSGQSIPADRTLVAGTFEGPPNTGITVNGVVAQTFGNQFLADNVPLTPGANVLTIVTSTIDGEIGRHSLTVNSNGVAHISVERVSGNVSDISTVAGTGSPGFSGDGAPAIRARFSSPSSVAVGQNGNVYILDLNNSRVRRIDEHGLISTFAGTGRFNFSGDGGLATQASLRLPRGIVVASDGSVYIADTGNNRIRSISPDGIIQTIAGTGAVGFAGDGGSATQARLGFPIGVAIAPDGTVYIADSNNHRIRSITPDGIIHTIAGTGESGVSGDGGPAIEAQLNEPAAIVIAPDGSLYFSETGIQNRIRRVSPAGIITTVVGTGALGFSGDGGPATGAQIGEIFGLAFGPDGSLYLADRRHHRIRRVDPNGIITTFAGTGVRGFRDNGLATQAQLDFPTGVAVDSSNTIYVADTENHRIRAVVSQTATLSNIAPVLTAFKVTDQTGEPVTRIEADFDGDGATDLTTTDPNAALRFGYAQPGVNLAKFTVTDTQGQIHVVTHPVVLKDVTAEDVMLRAVYTGMLDRLKAGNIDGALNAITGGMREKYQDVFTVLQPDLATVVDQVGTIQSGVIGHDMAEYVIVRNQNSANQAFLIYLIRGEDGVWRIDGM